MGQRCFPQWQPGYSVGNWVLDNQHKKLLTLCQHVIDWQTEEDDLGIFRFRTILDDLQDYADDHLRTEEALLAKCGFPLLAGHKAEHASHRRQLNEFLRSASHGELDQEGLSRYLSDWWVAHILESDKQYTAYIQRFR
nr:hemerythrin family protein [Dechloromonas sp. A34]